MAHNGSRCHCRQRTHFIYFRFTCLVIRSSFYTVHFTLFSFYHTAYHKSVILFKIKKNILAVLAVFPYRRLIVSCFSFILCLFIVQWKLCPSIRTLNEYYCLRCWFVSIDSNRVINIVFVWL